MPKVKSALQSMQRRCIVLVSSPLGVSRSSLTLGRYGTKPKLLLQSQKSSPGIEAVSLGAHCKMRLIEGSLRRPIRGFFMTCSTGRCFSRASGSLGRTWILRLENTCPKRRTQAADIFVQFFRAPTDPRTCLEASKSAYHPAAGAWYTLLKCRARYCSQSSRIFQARTGPPSLCRLSDPQSCDPHHLGCVVVVVVVVAAVVVA